MPILGFLGFSVLGLDRSVRCDRQTDGQTDRNHASFYNAPSYELDVGGVINNMLNDFVLVVFLPLSLNEYGTSVSVRLNGQPVSL